MSDINELFTGDRDPGKDVEELLKIILGSGKFPGEPGSEERREFILNRIVEDASRAVSGLPPICARCKRVISDARRFLYRCTECNLPFHRACIIYHFRDDG